MFTSHIRRLVVASVIAMSGLALSGCGKGDGLDGNTYHAASGGPVTIEFKDGKAKVELMGEIKVLDYKVNGDTVTIINKADGDLVLNRHPDGSLTSVLGALYPSKK